MSSVMHTHEIVSRRDLILFCNCKYRPDIWDFSVLLQGTVTSALRPKIPERKIYVVSMDVNPSYMN